MVTPCTKCGQEHPRCHGHNRRGGPCNRWPAADQDVCKLHGAESPQARAAARRRAVERDAAAELERLRRWQGRAEEPVADPLNELARLAGEAVAFKDFLRLKVEELDGTLAYWQEKDYLDGDGGTEWTKAAEDVRAVVAAYERSLERTAKILASLVKLDLAGRMLELNQAKAALIVDAVRYGLAQVDMPAEIRRATQDAIADAIAGLSRTADAPQPKELTA